MLYVDARKSFFESTPKFPVITCNLKEEKSAKLIIYSGISINILINI